MSVPQPSGSRLTGAAREAGRPQSAASLATAVGLTPAAASRIIARLRNSEPDHRSRPPSPMKKPISAPSAQEAIESSAHDRDFTGDIG
jgi:hypothetical protein